MFVKLHQQKGVAERINIFCFTERNKKAFSERPEGAEKTPYFPLQKAKNQILYYY